VFFLIYLWGHIHACSPAVKSQLFRSKWWAKRFVQNDEQMVLFSCCKKQLFWAKWWGALPLALRYKDVHPAMVRSGAHTHVNTQTYITHNYTLAHAWIHTHSNTHTRRLIRSRPVPARPRGCAVPLLPLHQPSAAARSHHLSERTLAAWLAGRRSHSRAPEGAACARVPGNICFSFSFYIYAVILFTCFWYDWLQAW